MTTTITVPQGDTVNWIVDVEDPDDPVDLTGATIRVDIYARPAEPLLTLTIGDGVTVVTTVQVGDTPAAVRCTLTAAQTELLPAALLTIEGKARLADGTVARIQHDRLLVEASSMGDLV